MLSAEELADWLVMFSEWDKGDILLTCNGMGITASNKLGRHFYSLQGYTAAEVDYIVDTIYPYL